MREFAKEFYTSSAWERCRKEYARSVSFLCERCMKDGIITTGEIVHHKKHITPDNINNPDITLCWDNLELLCRKCHGEEHRGKRRYKVDSFGRVVAI